MISTDRLKELLSYDPATGVFTWNEVVRQSRSKPGSVAGSITSYGYIQIKVDQQKRMAHRLAWQFVNGTAPPDDSDVDHINRVRADNRVSNLRLTSRKENQENRLPQKNNSSGISGVHFCNTNKKWVARIKHHQRTIGLGNYATYDEAVAARRKGEAIYFTHTPAL